MSHLRQERGAIALLTTIVISILLAIITTGLIGLMLSEMRQSTDSAQSAKAYYAAEAGVEEGVNKVIAALGAAKIDQLCPAVPSGGNLTTTKNLNLDSTTPGEVGWTCQQITYSGAPSGSLPLPDKAVQIDVGSGVFHSVILQWDLTPSPSASYFNPPSANLPGAGGWSYAAPLEMAVVEYPTGSFSATAAGAVTLSNVLALPHNGGIGRIAYSALKGGNPALANCNAGAASYHCSLTITNLPGGRSFMMRLRSRYVGTDYRLQFMTGATGNGAQVNVPDGMATIDVTAKAGDAFRRVVYKVPYRNSAAVGLDYVIFSDTDICKNFGIINGSVNPASIGCPY